MEARESGAIAYGIASASAEEIDALGIKEANRTAMLRALREIFSGLSDNNDRADQIVVRIDGNDHYHFPELGSEIDGMNIQYSEHIRGDSKYKEIAAASILAKVSRDHAMNGLHEHFPEY